ncbi:MAG TPA: C-GCAxxG-C-C family protein [Thermoleophilia bacterium]|nr:C-GCAxxG-C-C family protein [Thermoleophilia bacterium]
MPDLDVRVNELGLQGRCCTQIMVRLALEERGEENEQMAEAVGALCLGLFSGIGCGALAGGALAMWVLAGKPVDGELVTQLVDWFREQQGSTDCDVILGGDPSARLTRCPSIVAGTYAEARDLLDAHGLLPF